MRSALASFCVRTLVAALAWLQFAGCARRDDVFRMVTEPTYPPYEFLRGREVVGIDVEIGRMVAAKCAKSFAVVTVDFDAVLPALVSGRADMAAAGLTVTEDRLRNVDFSIPYMKTGLVIVFSKARPFPTVESCRGRRVGVQGGTTADEYCVRALRQEPERFRSYPEACVALKSGRCDLVLCDAILAKNCIRGEADLTLSELVTCEEYAIAVRKGDAKLLETVNRAIAEARADGRLDRWTAAYVAESEARR